MNKKDRKAERKFFKLRKRSLVTVRSEYEAEYSAKLVEHCPLIYLGDIRQMPDHGIFISHRTHKMFLGLHTFAFRELADEQA